VASPIWALHCLDIILRSWRGRCGRSIRVELARHGHKRYGISMNTNGLHTLIVAFSAIVEASWVDPKFGST
jgi:hypothetical protein